MTDMVHIDGSKGEGGGQVLRTSLSLSVLTGKPVRIENIRARRKKPGLLRQHLTAVRAAQELAAAEVEGGELSSATLVFVPKGRHGGHRRFAIGSAGSAALVCQTVLPILLHASEPSEVRFEGGTHNPMAPPFEFLGGVFFPVLRRMGFEVEAELETHGFYPAGGGAFVVRTKPVHETRPLDLLEAHPVRRVTATAIVSKLPLHIAERELEVVREGLGLDDGATRARTVRSPGPGNLVSIEIERSDDTRELVTAFGEKGRRAEFVAEEAVAAARQYLRADVPVGEHLADQLLLPLVLAGGRFRTHALSSHATTHIGVIRAFLGEHAIETREERGSIVVSGGRAL